MKASRRCAAVAWLVAIVVMGSSVWGQERPAQPPAEQLPPEIRRMKELMEDPELLREAMSDPEQLQEMMRSMQSEAVREYLRDPEKMRELMRNVDLQKLQQAMRTVDTTRIRTAMSGRLKEVLGATDEEWVALGPKVDAVVKAQQESRASFRGGMGGGIAAAGGGGVAGGAAPESSELAQLAAKLQAAARDTATPKEQIKSLLAEYRAAKERARLKLETAEKELRELLTARQEGLLVMMGLLN